MHENTSAANLPPDHNDRLERMQLSLDGLGLGDALGQMLSYQSADAPRWLAENKLPPGPWCHTDDTEMAISIVAVLKLHGEIDQDALAEHFARRFQRDPDRGYGSMTRLQLQEINVGKKWQDTANSAFGGRGSMGNGGAMRVAPLGAYFANSLGSREQPTPRPWSRTRIQKASRERLPSRSRQRWRGNCGTKRQRNSSASF